MMKIAIPKFGNRVSPRLDCAPAFLVVTFENGQSVDRRELAVADWEAHQRTSCLLELGVTAVICGGIDWWSAESLRSQGIALYSGVAGEIEDALAVFARGELDLESAAQSSGGGPHVVE
jgi:predicted Fe-Mo cluster-binding NifX family protein